MEKKQQIPGLNAESRTRGMLKGFDENSIQEFDFKILKNSKIIRSFRKKVRSNYCNLSLVSDHFSVLMSISVHFS